MELLDYSIDAHAPLKLMNFEVSRYAKGVADNILSLRPDYMVTNQAKVPRSTKSFKMKKQSSSPRWMQRRRRRNRKSRLEETMFSIATEHGNPEKAATTI